MVENNNELEVQRRPIPENPKAKQLTIIPKGAENFYSPKSDKYYFVEYNINEIMLERYEIVERFLVELGFSVTAESLLKNLLTALKLLKENESNDAYVVIFNQIKGIEDLQAKHLVTYWICTVFIYREDEDITTWDKQVANAKILDWKSCFDVGFFLELRNAMWGNLERSWEVISQTFSHIPSNPEETEKRREELTKKYSSPENEP